MDLRFEGLRQRLEELQVHLLATSNKTSSQSSSSRQKEKNRTEPKWPKEPQSSADKSNSTRRKDLNHKKLKIEEYEAPVTPKKHRQQPSTTVPAPPTQHQQPRFQSTISPSKSVLNSHNNGDAATVSGLLSRLREEEQKRISERAALQMQLQKEKQRAHHAETAARRAEDQRDFRLGEVSHLKAALKRRDDVITSLQDQVREMEVGISYAEAVQLAQGERDEAKAVLVEAQKQLEETSAQMDAAVAQAQHAQELLRRGERGKERAEQRWDRAHSEITRLHDDLHEERNARAILEQAVATLARHAADRQFQLRQLLAMGELLSGDADENCSIATENTNSVLDSEASYD